MEVKAVGQLENNRTEVVVQNKRGIFQRLSVPDEKKDEFITSYKKYLDKSRFPIFASLVLGAASGGFLGINLGAKLFKKKTVLSRMTWISGGILGGLITLKAADRVLAKRINKFLDRFDVKAHVPKDNAQDVEEQ